MKLFKAEVVFCKEVSPSYFKMRLFSDIDAEPGQFFHIKCSDSKFRLRRPFSLHRKLKDGFEILFEKKGEGTKFLSGLKNGDILDILGPCGCGFRIVDKSPIIVGGGIGIAPLLPLALRKKPDKVLLGAKNKDGLLCIDDFESLGIKPIVSTEDGSMGFKGKITDILQDYINSSCVIYACGPSKMLEVIIQKAKENNISCQISQEEMIACGVGACLGCAYKTRNGYKRVCKDGPVFDVRDL